MDEAIPAMNELEAQSALGIVAQSNFNEGLAANAELVKAKTRCWGAFAGLISICALLVLAGGVEMLVRYA